MDLRDDDDPGTRRRVRPPPVHNPYARRTPAPHSAGPRHAAAVTQSQGDAEPVSPRPHFTSREIRALFDIDDAVDAAPASDHHVRDGLVRDVDAADLGTAVDHNEPDAPADADRLAHDANTSEYNSSGRMRRVVADVAVEGSTDDAQYEGNFVARALAGAVSPTGGGGSSEGEPENVFARLLAGLTGAVREPEGSQEGGGHRGGGSYRG